MRLTMGFACICALLTIYHASTASSTDTASVSATASSTEDTASVSATASLTTGTSSTPTYQVTSTTLGAASSVKPTPSTTTPPATTTTVPSTTTSPPSSTVKFNVTIKIDEEFSDALLNASSTEHKSLTSRIEDGCNKTLGSLTGFERCNVKEFKNGSIIVLFEVIFAQDTNVTTTILKDAIENENATSEWGFEILEVISVSLITSIATTSSTSTPQATAEPSTPTSLPSSSITYKVTMKINETYSDALGNSSSTEHKNLTSRIEDACEKALESLKSFQRCEVKEFKKGSVIVLFDVLFGQDTTVTAAILEAAIKKANWGFEIIEITVKLATEDSTTGPAEESSKFEVWKIVLIVFGALFVIVIIILIVCLVRKPKRKVEHQDSMEKRRSPEATAENGMSQVSS